MTLITLPYVAELAAGQPEDIGMVLADLEEIVSVVNGDIRNDNIHASAAIAVSKLGITGTPDGTKFLRDDNTWQAPPSGVFLLVNDTILAAAAASYDVQNISGGRALQLEAYLRTDRAANGEDDIGVRFNNDSGANYDGYDVRMNAGTPTFGVLSSLAASSARLGNLACGDGAGANLFAAATLRVPHYNGTANFKQIIAHGYKRVGTSAGDLAVVVGGGGWRSGNAINRVTVIPITGANFKIDSRFSLYTL